MNISNLGEINRRRRKYFEWKLYTRRLSLCFKEKKSIEKIKDPNLFVLEDVNNKISTVSIQFNCRILDSRESDLVLEGMEAFPNAETLEVGGFHSPKGAIPFLAHLIKNIPKISNIIFEDLFLLCLPNELSNERERFIKCFKGKRFFMKHAYPSHRYCLDSNYKYYANSLIPDIVSTAEYTKLRYFLLPFMLKRHFLKDNGATFPLRKLELNGRFLHSKSFLCIDLLSKSSLSNTLTELKMDSLSVFEKNEIFLFHVFNNLIARTPNLTSLEASWKFKPEIIQVNARHLVQVLYQTSISLNIFSGNISVKGQQKKKADRECVEVVNEYFEKLRRLNKVWKMPNLFVHKGKNFEYRRN
eukprot:snap_masked-scaffold_88-processed-gene-0.19-mRNA-1 protein AED:1.00 eAED:1.00 QI:0/-1/0/0/-1/1/1/0/356